MTADEAEQRVLLSRRTLASFTQALKTHHVSRFNAKLFQEEIATLEAIGNQHPGQTRNLLALVGKWVDLRDRLARDLRW